MVVLFFAWREGAAASIGASVLALLVAATMAMFARASKAAALLLPYLAWVSFAALLTWSVWQRNPALLG